MKDRLAIQRGGRVPIMGKVPLKTRPPEGAYCAVRLLSDLEDCLPKVWSLPIIHDLQMAILKIAVIIEHAAGSCWTDPGFEPIFLKHQNRHYPVNRNLVQIHDNNDSISKRGSRTIF